MRCCAGSWCAVSADPGQPCELHMLRWCGDCYPPPGRYGGLLPGGPQTVRNDTGSPDLVYDGGKAIRTGELPDWQSLAATAAEARDYGPWVVSQYPGKCAGCGERWAEGDLIRFSEDESGWTAACCGAQE